MNHLNKMYQNNLQYIFKLVLSTTILSIIVEYVYHFNIRNQENTTYWVVNQQITCQLPNVVLNIKIASLIESNIDNMNQQHYASQPLIDHQNAYIYV